MLDGCRTIHGFVQFEPSRSAREHGAWLNAASLPRLAPIAAQSAPANLMQENGRTCDWLDSDMAEVMTV